ncbi:MAG TPA: asparagine synthase (glutamine-hydrolyzing) [bacterium]|nr:asparagine synthase (glutamine-hydrolyzing) [bacterium]
MCGIAGFVGTGTRDDIRRMTGAMEHRGPDAEGFWHDPAAGVFFGHRRLSILDIAGGAQPMSSVDGKLVIVFNGEIYNHLELRGELEREGARFSTDHSDTEVLLHGYRLWGDDFVGRLNGMWSFAIYDRERGRLFLSRDRFGKKPLFYSLQKGVFAFASELSALRKHGTLNLSHSEKALKKYFAYGYIPAPHTIFSEVSKLPGGCSLVYDLRTGDLRVSRYWDLEIEPFEQVPDNAEALWGEQIRALLSASVKRRLMSDVPLGVFLSGGIDSSAVTAYAVQHAGAERMKTFCIGFTEADFDESRYASRVARLFGTAHREEILSMEMAGGLVPELARRLDEPMGDASLLPTYLLARHTRREVTVALGGDGGDELFAGYDPFRALKAAALYDRAVPKPLHKAISLLAGRLPVSHGHMSLDFRIKRTLMGLDHPAPLWPAIWMSTLLPGQLTELFGTPTDTEELYEEAIASWDSCRSPDLVDKVLCFFTKLYLQDDILVKGDRASMMVSLEVRAPFLDIELVDFVRRIPARFKLRRGTTKYLLKKALEPLLPREILHRKKKGFGIPVGAWLKKRTLVVTQEEMARTGLNMSFMNHLYDDHVAGRADHRLFLWNLKMLGSWLEG